VLCGRFVNERMLIMVVPARIVGPSKIEAIKHGVNFLKGVYKKYGWEWSA
jgi:hypothetical protein